MSENWAHSLGKRSVRNAQKRIQRRADHVCLRQAESGTPVGDICRRLRMSEQSFYRWQKQFAGMGISEIRRLKQLEDKNTKLKRLVADLTLDKTMLQDVLRKKL